MVRLAGLGVQQPRHRHRILPHAPGKRYPTLIPTSWDPRPERQPTLLLASCLSLRLPFEEQMGSATFSLCQSPPPPQLPEGPRAACPELSPISLFIKEVAPFAFSVCCPLRASAVSSVVAPAACPWLGEEWPLSSMGLPGPALWRLWPSSETGDHRLCHLPAVKPLGLSFHIWKMGLACFMGL